MFLDLFMVASIAVAAPVSLLADVRTIPTPLGEFPSDFVAVGTDVFFDSGGKLWVTNGTPAGTRQVPLTGATPLSGKSRAVLGGKLYFVASSPLLGEELWVSDGTAPGTHHVADLCPGTCNANVEALTVHSARVYFVALGATAGRKGVYRVALADDNVELLNETFESTTIGGMVSFAGRLVLSADRAAPAYAGNEEQLWAIDPASPASPVNMCAGDSSCDPRSLFVASAGTLLFSGKDPTNGAELWRATGVASSGAAFLQGFAAGSSPGMTTPRFVVAADGTVFFTSDDGDLHKLAPAAGAAVNVTGALTGAQAGFAPARAIVGNRLFIAGDSPALGQELYSLTTADSSPTLVREICPGASDAFANDSVFVPGFGNSVMFAASDGVSTRLYASDGTAGGTVVVADIDVLGRSLMRANDLVYLSGTDGPPNQESWASNGTAAGTVRLGAVTTPVEIANSSPQFFSAGTTHAWFTARLDSGRSGLLAVRARDRRLTTLSDRFTVPDTFDSNGFFVAMRALGDRVIAVAEDSLDGETKLIVADGEGVQLLAGLGSPVSGRFLTQLEIAGGRAYTLMQVGSGRRLVETDGTQGGTRIVNAAGAVSMIAAVDGNRVFFARQVGGNTQLLVHHLAEGTTTLLEETTLDYPWSSSFANATVHLCIGNDPDIPDTFTTLSSDGITSQEVAGCTSAGFEPRPFAAGNIVVGPLGLVVGAETIAAAADAPALLSVLNARFFFTKNAPEGRELWVSDGSLANTRLVSDIALGPGSPNFGPFLALADVDRVVFAADDAANDRELWTSDGTAAGTFRVADLNPMASSSPSQLVRVGRFVFFGATHPTAGSEPFVLNVHEHFGPVADLSVEFLPVEARIAEPFSLTARVHNAGPGVPPSAVLALALPPNADLAEVPASCVAAGEELLCDLPSLAVGADLDLVLTLQAPAISILPARAELFPTTSFDSNAVNDVAMADVTVLGTVDLRLSSDDELRGAVAGDRVLVSLTVENAGLSAASLVVLRIALAPNTVLPGTYSGPCEAEGERALVCRLADLGAEERRGFVLPLRTTSSDSAAITFAIAAAEPDVDMSNNQLATQLEIAGRDIARIGELTPPIERGGCACRSAAADGSWLVWLLVLSCTRWRRRRA